MLCYAQPLSCVQLCNPMDCSLPGSSFMGFSRQEYWNGFPYSSPQDLPDAGIKLTSPVSPALAGRFFTTSATREAPYFIYIYIYIVYKHNNGTFCYQWDRTFDKVHYFF